MNFVVLGETTLTLLQEVQTPTMREGMTVQFRQPVSRQDFAEALKEAEQQSDIVQTLTKFVDKLLGAADVDELAPCLRSLYDHLPTAKNIFLIGPPVEGEEISHLIDPKLLLREGDKDEPGGVSRSLADMAIQRGEAILFSEEEVPNLQIKESTRLRGIRSAAYVPLLASDDKVLGVLGVDSPHSTLPLHEDNMQLLKSAGALLSSRLEGEKLRLEAQKRAVEAKENEARRETLANFLKIASHDLKNPLTVIRMCGRLIENFTQQPKLKDLAERLLDAEHRAEQLISSYLEVSELQSTQALTLKPVSCNLHKMVDKELQFLERAHERGERKVTLTNEVESLVVLADKQKMQQILNNLISNAIKYGNKEHPKALIKSTSTNREVILSVTDNGAGISEEDQKKLFSEFQRVGDVQKIPGTGLGLWLSNILVTAHGGRMWVKSKPGEGATFYFSLPR